MEKEINSNMLINNNDKSVAKKTMLNIIKDKTGALLTVENMILLICVVLICLHYGQKLLNMVDSTTDIIQEKTTDLLNNGF